MLPALLFALTLAMQDPKPPKTVEERLKELDEKVAALEKKHRTLSDDNAAMEKKLADRRAQVENGARLHADMMATSYGKMAQLSEPQTAELRESWYGWLMEDNDHPSTENRWVARESIFKGKLSAEQLAQLKRRLRDQRVQTAKQSMDLLFRAANLVPEKAALLQKAALEKISFPEDVLIAFAHPQEAAGDWGKTLAAVESSLSESTLTEEESKALRKVLDHWKPKQR